MLKRLWMFLLFAGFVCLAADDEGGLPAGLDVFKGENIKVSSLSSDVVKHLYRNRKRDSDYTLEINSVPLEELDNLKAVGWIRKVRIAGYGEEKFDLDKLNHLSTLRSLSISTDGIEDLEVLRNFKDLRALELSAASIQDIKFLRRLTNLKSLTITDVCQIDDYRPIGYLYALKELNMPGEKINRKNIGMFTRLRNLKSLAISKYRGRSLNMLRYCYDLESLACDNSPGLKDISALEKCSKLRTINLNATAVEDLSPLSSCSALELISIGSTNVVDLSPLARCTKLVNLDISGAKVTTLKPLFRLRRLVVLSGTDNIPEEEMKVILRKNKGLKRGEEDGEE